MHTYIYAYYVEAIYITRSHQFKVMTAIKILDF
jgi:hypothetical protein